MIKKFKGYEEGKFSKAVGLVGEGVSLYDLDKKGEPKKRKEPKFVEIRKENLRGYDEEGDYSILGIVGDSAEFVRKGKGTIITRGCGYTVKNHETGEVKHKTVDEVVEEVDKRGLRNGYIQIKTKSRYGKYIAPYPPTKVKYHRIEQVTSLYDMEESGKVKKPKVVVINREKCSERMLEYIKNIEEEKKGK